MMSSSLVLVIFVIGNGFLLMTVNGMMSAELRHFTDHSGIGSQCKTDGLSDEECITRMKEMCGMQNISDTRENEELLSCTARDRCGKSLRLMTDNKRATRATKNDHPQCLNYQKAQCNDPWLKENCAHFCSSPGIGFQWPKKNLKFFVYNAPQKTTLSKADIEEYTELALGVWECYTNLRFHKVSSLTDADIVVMFYSGHHGFYHQSQKRILRMSDQNPLDGPGRVLAHAFYPIMMDPRHGNVHMDNAEFWSANQKPGTVNAFNVLVHELGHSLGLQHSKYNGDIMAPFNSNIREADVDLGRWEKSVIQQLYGQRPCNTKRWQTYFSKLHPKKGGNGHSRCAEYPRTECRAAWMRENCADYCATKPKQADHPKCETFPKSQCKDEWMKINCPRFCSLNSRRRRSGDTDDNAAHVCKQSSLQGIFDYIDGYTYIIADGHVYRRDNEDGVIDMDFRPKVTAMWKGAPKQPTGAVYSRATSSLFLFEGNTVFVVSGLKGDIDSKSATVKRLKPKDAKYPMSPSAAFIKFDDRESGNVHLVKGKSVFVLNTKTMQIVKTMPFKDLFEVGDYVKRIPRSVDGAYHLFEADSDHNPADSLFFFTGSSYTVALPNPKTGKYSIPSGTRPFATTYLHCPQK